jgi:hypothetical protein
MRARFGECVLVRHADTDGRYLESDAHVCSFASYGAARAICRLGSPVVLSTVAP